MKNATRQHKHEWGILLIGIGAFGVIFAIARILYYFDHQEWRRDHD